MPAIGKIFETFVSGNYERAQGTFCGPIFPENTWTFPSFSDFWIDIVMMMQPRVALELTLNIFLFYLGKSVLNPDFTLE